VDDEADIRAYLSVALEDAGFRVATASNGREALEAVKRERPAFVSLDLVMPGGSGIHFLHELRRHKEWSSIPVMVLTGHAQDELGRADLAKALEGSLLSGPQTYLEKPVTPKSYVAAVCHCLGIEAPQTGVNEGALRAEAVQLLKDLPEGKLSQVLELLKSR